MNNLDSLPSSYEALAAAERDRILSTPGFDGLTPELRHAVSLLCASYLHKGATWAIASIMDGGPSEMFHNCVTVSLDLLSHIPTHEAAPMTSRKSGPTNPVEEYGLEDWGLIISFLMAKAGLKECRLTLEALREHAAANAGHRVLSMALEPGVLVLRLQSLDEARTLAAAEGVEPSVYGSLVNEILPTKH